MESDFSQQMAIVSIAVANIAGLVTFFVSLKVSQAEMKVRLDRMEKDLDRLGAVMGTQRSKGQTKEE